jgi:membrane protease YdiL (CAAX protease family)
VTVEEFAIPAETPPRVLRLRTAIALVLGVLGLNLLVGRIVRAISVSSLSAAQVSLAMLATFAILYVVELGAVASVIHRAGGRGREWVGLEPLKVPGKWIGIALAASFATRVAATAYAAFMLALGWRLQGWNSDPTRFFPHDLFGSAVLIFVVVIAAPIAEEIVFRGVLLPSLAAHTGEGRAIAVSALVFAAMHLNMFSFVPILLVGWVLAWLYLRSGSLWVAIIGHSAFNAFGVAVVLALRWRIGL